MTSTAVKFDGGMEVGCEAPHLRPSRTALYSRFGDKWTLIPSDLPPKSAVLKLRH